MAPVPADNHLLARIESLLKEHPRGMTTSDITRSLNSNRNSVAKYLEILLSSGIVERKQVGASRVYTLTKKVAVGSLLDFISDLIIVLDARKKIVMVNQSLLRFFSLSRETLVGTDLASAPVGMLRELGRDKSLCNPCQEVISERAVQIDSGAHQFRLKCIPTLFEDRDTGYTIVITDITEQKKYEEELRAGEAKYRAVVEDQTDLICRRQPDGTITFVNGAFLRFFNRTADEIVGKLFFPGENTRGTAYGSSEPLAGIHHFSRPSSEQEILLESGERRSIQWKNSSLHDETGAITEIQSVGRDITVQRQREREILLRQCAIEYSGQATAICDMMSRIVFANRAFRELFRCGDEAHVTGKPLDKFVLQSGPATNVGQIMQTTRETGRWDGLFRGVREDSSEFDVRMNSTVLANDAFFPFHGIALFSEVTGKTTGRDSKKLRSTQVPARSGHLTLDSRGRVMNADGTFLSLSGYENGLSFLGKPASRILGRSPGEPVGSSKNPWTGLPGSVAGEIQKSDGHSLPVWVTARDVCDSAGRLLCSELAVVPGMISYNMNFAEMFEYVPNPAFMIDPGKRVILWNRAMEVFTGTPKEEIMGTERYREALSAKIAGTQPPLIDLVGLPEKEIQRVYPASRKYGDVLILERHIPGNNPGEAACYYNKASPVLNPDGVLTGVLETFHDITDRKRDQADMDAMRDAMDRSLSRAIAFLNRTPGTTGP